MFDLFISWLVAGKTAVAPANPGSQLLIACMVRIVCLGAIYCAIAYVGVMEMRILSGGFNL